MIGIELRISAGISEICSMLLEYLPKLKPLNDPNVGKSTIHGAYGLEYVKSRSPGFIPYHPPRAGAGPFRLQEQWATVRILGTSWGSLNVEHL